MMASFEFGTGFFDRPLLVGLVMVGVAILMVSRVPTFSFKRLKVRPRSVLPVMIGVGGLIVLVISTPWIAFLGLALCYLATIPVSILYYRRLAARRTIVEPVDPVETLPH